MNLAVPLVKYILVIAVLHLLTFNILGTVAVSAYPMRYLLHRTRLCTILDCLSGAPCNPAAVVVQTTVFIKVEGVPLAIPGAEAEMLPSSLRSLELAPTDTPISVPRLVDFDPCLPTHIPDTHIFSAHIEG